MPEKTERLLTSKVLFGFANDIANGLAYLAASRVVHRDLAARNCLVSGPIYVVKIGDFGFSRTLNTSTYYRPRGSHPVLPVRWLPPEALLDEHKHSEKSDVWSFGVVVWEIFSGGRRPWDEHKDNAQVRDAVLAGATLEPLPSFPPVIVDLTVSCMAFDKEKRPSADDIVGILKPYVTARKSSETNSQNYLL